MNSYGNGVCIVPIQRGGTNRHPQTILLPPTQLVNNEQNLTYQPLCNSIDSLRDVNKHSVLISFNVSKHVKGVEL